MIVSYTGTTIRIHSSSLANQRPEAGCLPKYCQPLLRGHARLGLRAGHSCELDWLSMILHESKKSALSLYDSFKYPYITHE